MVVARSAIRIEDAVPAGFHSYAIGNFSGLQLCKLIELSCGDYGIPAPFDPGPCVCRAWLDGREHIDLVWKRFRGIALKTRRRRSELHAQKRVRQVNWTNLLEFE